MKHTNLALQWVLHWNIYLITSNCRKRNNISGHGACHHGHQHLLYKNIKSCSELCHSGQWSHGMKKKKKNSFEWVWVMLASWTMKSRSDLINSQLAYALSNWLLAPSVMLRLSSSWVLIPLHDTKAIFCDLSPQVTLLISHCLLVFHPRPITTLLTVP